MRMTSFKLLWCLRDMGETQRAFAKKLGISMTCLRSFIHEGKEPSLRIAFKIEELTDKMAFQVKAKEWLDDQPASAEKEQDYGKQNDIN